MTMIAFENTKEIDYDGVMFTYSTTIPEHTPEEIDRIAESMDRFGQQAEVLHNCDCFVYAGVGRLLAALKLGWPLSKVRRREVETDDPLTFSIQANLVGREWTREKLVLLAHRLRREGWSTARIGEALGKDQKTAWNFLQEPDLEPPTDDQLRKNPKLDRTVGKDGKSRPASRPKAADTADHRDQPEAPTCPLGQVESEAAPEDESLGRTDVQSIEPTEDKADNAVAPPKPPARPQDDGGHLQEAIKLFGSVARSCTILGKLEAVTGDLVKIAGALGLSVSDRDAEIEKLRAACKQLLAIAEEAGVYQSTKAAWRHLYNSVVENKQNAASEAATQPEAPPAANAVLAKTNSTSSALSKPARARHYGHNGDEDGHVEQDYDRQPEPPDDFGQASVNPDDEIVEVVL